MCKKKLIGFVRRNFMFSVIAFSLFAFFAAPLLVPTLAIFFALEVI